MEDLPAKLDEIAAHYSACERQQTIYAAAREIEALTAGIDELRQVVRLLTDPATQAEALRIYRDRIKENGNASVTR